jgi:hypothetical protein
MIKPLGLVAGDQPIAFARRQRIAFAQIILLIRPCPVITFHLRSDESEWRDSRERNFTLAGRNTEL